MGRCFTGQKSKLKIYGLFLVLIFTFVYPAYAQEPDWLIKLRKLKVLESTKADVEREFDLPKVINSSSNEEREKNREEYITYKTAEGTLEVDYSIETCSELSSLYAYNVSAGTIIEISFKPNKPVKATLLNFDLESFRMERVSDMPDLTIYRNLEDGIKISMVKGNVTKIRYSPSAKYDYLECKTT
jgi:hypothetical protein